MLDSSTTAMISAVTNLIFPILVSRFRAILEGRVAKNSLFEILSTS